ncbi:hypothetical protein IW148_005036 [Coemansia sp. RSA 1199]|nr:hypothetical protein IW148_005036 [Coemansia sp. RSA 1199]
MQGWLGVLRKFRGAGNLVTTNKNFTRSVATAHIQKEEPRVRIKTETQLKTKPVARSHNPWDSGQQALEQSQLQGVHASSELNVWLYYVRHLHNGTSKVQKPQGVLYRQPKGTSKAEDSNTVKSKTDGKPKNTKSYMNHLTLQQRLDREFVLAHILALRVKGEVARGRHTGSAQFNARSDSKGDEQTHGWESQGDPRGIRVAMLAQAQAWGCPALVLNVLLDWTNNAPLVSRQFLDRLCQEHLGTKEKVERTENQSRKLYEMIGVQGTQVVDHLWQADNAEEALQALCEMVEQQKQVRVGRNMEAKVNAGSRLIASLAMRLMHECVDHGRGWMAYAVFAECEEYVKHEPAAYTVLLHAAVVGRNYLGVTAVLQRMQRTKCEPDAWVWTAVLDGLWRTGKGRQAQHLFALHLLFLSHPEEDGSSGLMTSPYMDMWRSWHTAKRDRGDPLIWEWIHELANRFKYRDSHDRIAWRPTMTTHRIMLEHLGRNAMKPELIAYLDTLRNMWHVYRKWLYPRNHRTSNAEVGSSDYWHGFRSLEKIVLRHLRPEAETDAESWYNDGYYMFCGEILDLAQTTIKASSKLVYPESVTRVAQLEESARLGDMRTIVRLMHEHPELDRQDTWVRVVRCICVQVKMRPDSARIRRPGLLHAEGGWTSWAEFIIAMCTMLAARGIHMPPLGFNLMVRTACSMGDMDSVLALTAFMRTRTRVRFHAGMMSSVLSVYEVPYATKCELFLHMLQSAARVNTRAEWSNVAVRVNSTLVSRMVRRAESPQDLRQLRKVLDVLGREHCVELGERDFDRLRYLARDNKWIREELKTWKNV